MIENNQPPASKPTIFTNQPSLATMVCASGKLPLLKLQNHETVSCEVDWISAEISKAMRSAGLGAYLDWLVVDGVSLAVEDYLKNVYPDRAITVEELHARIEAALRHLGLEEVAEHLSITPPPLKISLSELAHCSAPPRAVANLDQFMELLFRRLGLRSALSRRDIICEDLDEAVTVLRARGCDYSASELRTLITDLLDTEIRRRFPDGIVRMAVIR